MVLLISLSSSTALPQNVPYTRRRIKKANFPTTGLQAKYGKNARSPTSTQKIAKNDRFLG
ncbi:hypothetical protein COV06_02050 [Candidatus Uhrbacteria bacterium CG10_big_fil_rev_8_21_14_0_10_50_16]|uniref:Uncharacterized protein n=1 Tax=Candidatus Uhrbacteria bacterium CG10_big_fil_rev_8_21_14_0_10_50_16 TaxID=1975039 RepID=A0A2H0RP31_9BACT|nr:MAG: hypothetical protein COV06_02050 [Candidatus Uhrbacteria bacterium CG10_big_fil_rev_8_21_14_0_10_50_16]